MRGGGKIEDGVWKTKVRNLRYLDCIQAKSWNLAGYWWAGETLVVLCASPDGDGYWDVWCYDPEWPENERQLTILPDDDVTLVAREVNKPSSPLPVKKPTKAKTPKPKKGEQLKLL